MRISTKLQIIGIAKWREPDTKVFIVWATERMDANKAGEVEVLKLLTKRPHQSRENGAGSWYMLLKPTRGQSDSTVITYVVQHHNISHSIVRIQAACSVRD
jgi:hypothetical protein